jgi:hypothetical protein
MGRKGHAWVDKRRINAMDLMDGRAWLTTDLAEELNKHYRHEIRPRSIYNVLKGDKRFVKIREVKVDSVARTKSHTVWLFGRADRVYGVSHPWTAMKDVKA